MFHWSVSNYGARALAAWRSVHTNVVVAAVIAQITAQGLKRHISTETCCYLAPA